MADSILRLKVDSQEYDQKIRRAAEGIQQYAQKCREVGGTLEHLDDGVLEFVQALGQMDTVATSSRQQLREMGNALTTLTMTYRDLTDEEKASPFGQELSKGIQQLTERAGQVKDAMMDVEASIRNAASDTRLFDQMAQGISVATAGFQGLTGAGKLLGIEMGNDVEVIAMLQAAMAVTNSLTTIQTALQKQSALMQGLNAIKASDHATAQALLAKNTALATAEAKVFNAVAAASPVGLLVTALGAAAGAYALFSSSADSAADSQSGFNSVLDETKRKIDAIIESEERLKQTRDYLGGKGKYETMVEDLESLQRQWDELERLRKTHLAPPRPGNTQSNIVKEGHIEEYNQIVDQQNQIATQARKLQENIKAYEDAAVYLKTEWRFLTDPREIRAAISLFTEEFDNLDISKRFDKEAQVLQDKIKYLQDNLRKLQTGTDKATGSKTSKADETETQKLQKNIESLTKEYQKLSDVQKTATDGDLAKITERKAAIQSEIKDLQNRIAELKKWEEEATGNSKEVTEAYEQVAAATKNLGDAQAETAKAISKNDLKGFYAGNKKIVAAGGQADPTMAFTYTSGNLDAFISNLKEQISQSDLGTDLYNNLTSQLSDATMLGNLMQEAVKNGIDIAQFEPQKLWDKIFKSNPGDYIEDEVWDNLAKAINDELKKRGVKIAIDTNTGSVSEAKGSQKNNQFLRTNKNGKQELALNSWLSGSAAGISSIKSGLEDLGVKLGSGWDKTITKMNAIASILTGIATISSAIEAIILMQSFKFWNTGGIVHAASGYFVPGNFGYDAVPSLLTSGELVLNKAQQGALASQLQDTGHGGYVGTPYTTGETIVLGVNNHFKRSGQGEIVTTGMLKRMGVI